MLGLPTKDDLRKPEGMSERDWGMVFDERMKRHDAFMSGLICGILFVAEIHLVISMIQILIGAGDGS